MSQNRPRPDPLTGLPDRRDVARIVASIRCWPGLVACVRVDVDGLERVNLRLGRSTGDAVIRTVARCLRSAAGTRGAAIRWEGAEFLLLQPAPDPTEAWIAAERLRRDIARARSDQGLPTVSIGLACLPARELDEEALNRTDHALQLAREHGRDRVRTWEMVVVERLAAWLEFRSDLSPEQRRLELFRRLECHLGPAQLEHLTAHSEQVSLAAGALARLMGVAPGESERIRLAGLFHDIGKAVIPETLLSRPRALTHEERGLMDQHAETGGDLAAYLGLDPHAQRLVRLHHTRFDAAIAQRPPLGARVLCVADALVAMTSDRPYSRQRPVSAALAELRAHAGGQFDPLVVAAAQRLHAGALARAA